MPNFPYDANKPAAILFAVLFALTLAVHIFQATRARALFMLVLVIATGLQVIGYAFRYVSIVQDTTLWPLIISQVAIVVSPAFLAAQDYMIVGRMMSFVGPGSSFISHTVITKVFVFIDIVCVLTQALGITVLTNTDTPSLSQVQLGRTILIAGLVAQIASFLFFVVITIAFDRKTKTMIGARISELRPLFTAFYISAALIIGRSVYRTIEFGTIDFTSSTQGYLYNNEWPFYVLDSVPILIATVLLNIVYPAVYLPRKKGVRMDGSVEEPRRHWWSKATEKSNATSASVSQDVLMTRV